MNGHFLGGEFEERADSASSPYETSMVVRQFVAIANGEVMRHQPRNPWRVLEVVWVQRYCQSCFGERNHDVIVGEGRKFFVCRCCGCEVMHVG